MDTYKLDPWEQLQTLVCLLVWYQVSHKRGRSTLAKCEELVITGVHINDYISRSTQNTYGYNFQKTYR